MEWAPWLANLGTAMGLVAILFLSLRSGALWTGTSVAKALEAKDQVIKLQEDYILRLEAKSDKMDERNDVLAGQVGGAIEMARASGMLSALPPGTAERIAR